MRFDEAWGILRKLKEPLEILRILEEDRGTLRMLEILGDIRGH